MVSKNYNKKNPDKIGAMAFAIHLQKTGLGNKKII